MQPATIIREKLNNYLEELNDDELLAVYSQHEADVERKGVQWTTEFIAEMNNRLARMRSGETKTIRAEESKRRIDALLIKYGTA